MGTEVYSTEEFLEEVECAEEGDHIVFVNQLKATEVTSKKIRMFRSAERLARKKSVDTSLIGAPQNFIKRQRLRAHKEAYQDLSMIETTVMDFLQNLRRDADSELEHAIDVVQEEIMNA